MDMSFVFIAGVLYVLEQIINCFTISYVYRVGMPVKKIDIKDRELFFYTAYSSLKNLYIKINKNGEGFIRYKLPHEIFFGFWPFVGYIKDNVVVIKIGPFAILFLLSIILVFLGRCYKEFFDLNWFVIFNFLINIFVILLVVFWYYSRFKEEIYQILSSMDV